MRTEDFVHLFKNPKQKNLVRYGTITHIDGRPRVKLDGETTSSIKRYTRLASYTPAVNDRVMIVNGVIIGKII